MMSTLRSQLRGSGLPLLTIADMSISSMRYTVEGNDSLGYKIITESPGAAAQHAFVVREGEGYKLAGFSPADSAVARDLAPLALRAIEKNDLVAARTWLDRARDELHITGGDDPLAGEPFPYFWTKGQEADASTARTAALVLLRPRALKGRYLDDLKQAREQAKSPLDRGRLTMVLAYAFGAQERWADRLPLVEELTKNFPTSLRAYDLAETTYEKLNQYDKWEAMDQDRIREHPDEMGYLRSATTLDEYRGDFRKARETLKTIIDKGRAAARDLNEYAWDALFLTDPIGRETIDTAQRAVDLDQNNGFASLHTLACVEAQAGMTTPARELLLKAMGAAHLEEPNSAVWFGFALIAEQYGLPDAARKMYQRVEKPKQESPVGTYTLAQEHLKSLAKAPGEPVHTARQ